MAPTLRQWVGGRLANALSENGETITNAKYEATLEIESDDRKYDRYGQVQNRIDMLADRAVDHWDKLLSTLVINGEATDCYDGEYFFDDDHEEGDSGAQSNDLSIDISALAAQVHGSITAPSVEEMALCILQAIQAILGFKDDRGEPINGSARSFVVLAPVPLWGAAFAAVTNRQLASGADNILASNSQFQIEVRPNPRLTWTTKAAVFRTDGPPPLIRQARVAGGDGAQSQDDMADVVVSALAEGSDEEFKTGRHLYGVEANRGVGYGFWQSACLFTMA